MPSPQHDAPLLLFREVPELLVRVLRELAHVESPPYERLSLGPTELTAVVSAELRPDYVLVLEGERGPVFGVLFEVQRAIDEDKRFVWPRYHAELVHRLRVPCALVVLTLDERIARWARRRSGLMVGVGYQPVVIGPAAVPWVESPEEAAKLGDLAILSALVHENRKGGARVAAAVLEAVSHLEVAQRDLYTDLIFAALDAGARQRLESLMGSPGHQWQSDLVQMWMNEGAEKGEKRGRVEGRVEGRAEGKAQSVLAFLAARGLAVPEALRATILGCGDEATLDRWIARAATCASAEDVLEG